eukprot:766702-Hanusia_phi.AAC.2
MRGAGGSGCQGHGRGRRERRMSRKRRKRAGESATFSPAGSAGVLEKSKGPLPATLACKPCILTFLTSISSDCGKPKSAGGDSTEMSISCCSGRTRAALEFPRLSPCWGPAGVQEEAQGPRRR